MNKFQIAGCTDVGRARQHNEDSMISFESPNGYVVAVCDGMGGENGGETASNLAVAIIQDILVNNTFATPAEAITVACNAANQGILHRASTRPELEGMGSTCVMALIKNGQIHYGTIGDSRIYYYSRTQGLVQLSKDQSYVQTLVDSGEITPEEAESHPRKNEILNALGLDGMTPPVVCEQPVPVSAGGMMLLCSDGLSGMVPDFTIEQVLARPGLTPQQRCEKLINMANEAGGLDNITIQIIDCDAAAAVDAATPCQGQHPSPSTAKSAAAPKQKKSFAWVGIAIASLLLCAVVGYLAWDHFAPAKKHSSREDAEDEKIEITKKDGSGKVQRREGRTVVVKGKDREAKPAKKEEPATKKETPAERNIRKSQDKNTPVTTVSKKIGETEKNLKPEPKPKEPKPKEPTVKEKGDVDL